MLTFARMFWGAYFLAKCMSTRQANRAEFSLKTEEKADISDEENVVL